VAMSDETVFTRHLGPELTLSNGRVFLEAWGGHIEYCCMDSLYLIRSSRAKRLSLLLERIACEEINSFDRNMYMMFTRILWFLLYTLCSISTNRYRARNDCCYDWMIVRWSFRFSSGQISRHATYGNRKIVHRCWLAQRRPKGQMDCI